MGTQKLHTIYYLNRKRKGIYYANSKNYWKSYAGFA